MKFCSKCKLDKSFNNFYKSKIRYDGLQVYCKSCQKIFNSNWKKLNSDKIKSQTKKLRLKYPEKYKEKDKLKMREWRKNNQELSNNTARKYRQNNPESTRNSDLKKNYGIDLTYYNKLLKEQNDCCFICKKHKSIFNKNLAVDHCHKTGKVRGLLCQKCNYAIGLFNDDINIIKNSITYLERNS